MLPQLGSLQLPLEPLQGGGSFVRSNNRLAVFAVADAHQNGDILKSLFDKRQVMTQLNCLLVGEGLQIIS